MLTEQQKKSAVLAESSDSFPKVFAGGVCTAGAYHVWADGACFRVPDDSGFAMRSGRNIQPFYEGWQKLPNGRNVMWFGYLNRNFEVEADMPVGPNNRFDLHPDMGQPTHFYPRRQRFVFWVEVPVDWPV